MITVESSGSFKNTEAFLQRMKRGEVFKALDKYGKEGVDALSKATPIDTSFTGHSWTYKIIKTRGQYTIEWHNTNIVDGIPVVILIQYGHATGTGGYVQGRDFINPVIRPLFDKIANEIWKEVVRNG